jgi:DNA-binding ferritin-like protein
MDRDNVWEKIRKNFKEGAALSIEKIEEYSKIGKLKIEEYAAKKKIERNCVDIGERVFDLAETGKTSEAANDLLVKKAIENIRALNEELAFIDSKVKAISEDARKTRTRAADPGDPVGV